MRALRQIAVAVMFLGAAAVAPRAQAPSGPSSAVVVVHGHHLQFHFWSGNLPALVLDAGGGADSSYWSSIIPELAKRTGSEIITYDRAGFGASDEVPPPFRMQDAVADLEAGLRQLGATHDLILVPHSFAGAISTYLAMRHPGWIAGAVLVDTNVPEFFTDEEVAHLAPIMLPMVAAELAAHPSKQTRTLNAITEAFVETSHDFHNAAWPASIPCVVIVSETSPFPETMKPEVEHWKQAHIDFAQKAPNRALITAAGSSHDIAHDRPKVIVDEVGKLVDNLRASTSGAPR